MAPDSTPRAEAIERHPGRGSPGTRDAIVERAVDLASAEGLQGLTIGRLASELGLSKSGLFGHFGSKEELQLAAVDAAARRFVAEVVEPALAFPEGRERLAAICERYIDYLERRVFPGGCFWVAAAAEFDSRPGRVRDAVHGAVAAWLGLLDDQAARAGARDPAQTAFELHAIAQGANTACELLGDERAFARARTAVARLLAAAVGGPAPVG